MYKKLMDEACLCLYKASAFNYNNVEQTVSSRRGACLVSTRLLKVISSVSIFRTVWCMLGFDLSSGTVMLFPDELSS